MFETLEYPVKDLLIAVNLERTNVNVGLTEVSITKAEIQWLTRTVDNWSAGEMLHASRGGLARTLEFSQYTPAHAWPITTQLALTMNKIISSVNPGE